MQKRKRKTFTAHHPMSIRSMWPIAELWNQSPCVLVHWHHLEVGWLWANCLTSLCFIFFFKTAKTFSRLSIRLNENLYIKPLKLCLYRVSTLLFLGGIILSVNEVQALSLTKVSPMASLCPPLLFLACSSSHSLSPRLLFSPELWTLFSVLFIFAHTALPSYHSTFTLQNLFSIKLQPSEIECCNICAPSQTFCARFFISLSFIPPLD